MSIKILKLPILPLVKTVLFPGSVVTLNFEAGQQLDVLRDCWEQQAQLALVHQTDNSGAVSQYAPIGVAAKVLQIKVSGAEQAAVTLDIGERLELIEFEEGEQTHFGTFQQAETRGSIAAEKFARLAEILESEIGNEKRYAPAQLELLRSHHQDIGAYLDFAAQQIHLPFADKLALLLDPKLPKRAEQFAALLARHGSPETLVSNRVEGNDRPSVIGAAAEGDDNLSVSFRPRAQMLGELPLSVREQVFLETERLRLISTASAEYSSIKGYLDWLLAIPWARVDQPRHNLGEMQKIIESRFYGPQAVKDLIVEYLATRQEAAGVPSSPLCLCGPAGTGKAALAHAIAEALGRQWIRFSVAGLMDGIDIHGEPRSLVGAMPGKLVTSLIEANTNNPVMLIEDLDKLCQDENRLAAALALLAAIDPKQNGKFMDHYIGLPLDLSKVIFVFSVRNTEEIPEALLERMEVVDFPGYIDKEKLLISKKHLIPDLLKRYDINPEKLSFSQDAIKRLISNYTMEAGLGQLKGRLEAICRRFAKTKAAGERQVHWAISADNVEDYVGTPIYLPEKAATHPEVGVAAGVAWTGAGGDIMMIEGLKMRGGGQVACTGSLGEVMRESVQAAHSFVRSKADLLSIDHEDFATYDIHIHFPQGAIPKDGPSAGVTISLVIASVMSDRPIRNDIAMTGEVSLRGRVLPVAGVKEKVAAAHRAGIFKFVLPRFNQKDLKDIPADLKREMEFIFIDRTDQLFEIALLDYEPGAETLEELLLIEMKERAVSNKKKKGERAAKSGRAAKLKRTRQKKTR
jgi:ATP-dependent Lon protease